MLIFKAIIFKKMSFLFFLKNKRKIMFTTFCFGCASIITFIKRNCLSVCVNYQLCRYTKINTWHTNGIKNLIMWRYDPSMKRRVYRVSPTFARSRSIDIRHTLIFRFICVALLYMSTYHRANAGINRDCTNGNPGCHAVPDTRRGGELGEVSILLGFSKARIRHRGS